MLEKMGCSVWIASLRLLLRSHHEAYRGSTLLEARIYDADPFLSLGEFYDFYFFSEVLVGGGELAVGRERCDFFDAVWFG